MLHPQLIERMAETNRDDIPGLLRALPGADSDALDRLRGGPALKLHDVTRILDTLDRLRLTLDLTALPEDLLRLIVPGRLPEFHAPLRLYLGKADVGPALADIVAALTADLPWWPEDLAPARFAGKAPGPTLIGTLIDLLDRVGRLPDLAAALAERAGPEDSAARIAGLIDAFSAVLRGGNL
jgi:hypothetical protein